MKTYIGVLLMSFLFVSCSDSVEFNNPAMQGNFEGQSWRAVSFAGDIDFQGFLVEGVRGAEVLQLITLDNRVGVYALGPESTSEAIFKDSEGVVYSTKNTPDPSVTIYPAEGIITITDIEDSQPTRLKGTFRFTAFSEDGLRSVNFIDGVLFNVSLTGDLQPLNN